MFSASTVQVGPRFFRQIEHLPLRTDLDTTSYTALSPQLTGPLFPTVIERRDAGAAQKVVARYACLENHHWSRFSLRGWFWYFLSATNPFGLQAERQAHQPVPAYHPAAGAARGDGLLPYPLFLPPDQHLEWVCHPRYHREPRWSAVWPIGRFSRSVCACFLNG